MRQVEQEGRPSFLIADNLEEMISSWAQGNIVIPDVSHDPNQDGDKNRLLISDSSTRLEVGRPNLLVRSLHSRHALYKDTLWTRRFVTLYATERDFVLMRVSNLAGERVRLPVINLRPSLA